MNSTAARYRRASLTLGLVGLLAWWCADIDIRTLSPGQELLRMLHGLLTPDFFAVPSVADALVKTLAFALQSVAFAALAGFLLALMWHLRIVRAFSAAIRAVHELFWGLIFLQLTGLTPLTGILAIAIPYSGIFAKVFGEFLEESDARPMQALSPSANKVSLFFYARLPLVWSQFKLYAGYRLECAIRSSTILGFIGLPTLGFHLETALRQGDYPTGAALLYLFFVVIISMRWWLRARLMPLYLIGALIAVPPQGLWQLSTITRFFSEDIVPAPLRLGTPSELPAWLADLAVTQVAPGLINTLLLSTAALLLTALLSLIGFTQVSRHFHGPVWRRLAHAVLVMVRTIPEFLLAFVLMLPLGPSMLPGILALGVHTAAILSHLLGRLSDNLVLRPDSPRGLNRYAFELLPRLYGNFLALLLYRWEIILRESAILGLIGIPTLGFYIDSAFSEFRFDRAMLLIAVAVALNLLVDALSRQLRKQIRSSNLAWN